MLHSQRATDGIFHLIIRKDFYIFIGNQPLALRNCDQRIFTVGVVFGSQVKFRASWSQITQISTSILPSVYDK